MDSQFRKYVDEFGGKHGPLLYIRDFVSGGTNLVPPMEISNLAELACRDVAPDIVRGIRSACKELEVNEYIARTSLMGWGDFNGLVDATPTISHIPLGTLEQGNYPSSVARTLLDMCKNPDLINFAANEGVAFDPSRVTVSFSPQLPFPHSTITEHPNRPDVTMVDISRPAGDGSYRDFGNVSETDTATFENERLPYRSLASPELMRAGLNVRQLLMEAGFLDHDHCSYQYEGACRGAEVPHWLLQIRFFAPRVNPDFELERGSKAIGRTKLMGVTPRGGTVMKYFPAMFRAEAVDFEKENPHTSYLLDLATVATTNPLTLSDQLRNVLGYVVAEKPFLSHQNTRFAQRCLRQPGGFVELNTFHPQIAAAPYSDVRIICDGTRRIIEMA